MLYFQICNSFHKCNLKIPPFHVGLILWSFPGLLEYHIFFWRDWGGSTSKCKYHMLVLLHFRHSFSIHPPLKFSFTHGNVRLIALDPKTSKISFRTKSWVGQTYYFLYFHKKEHVFSCPGSSIPDLGDWVGDCHFWILTQRVTLDTWDPSDIWSEWCPDKKTNRQKTKRQKRQKSKTKKTV